MTPGGCLGPQLDADSEPWWRALAGRRLLLPRCNDCGQVWFPPTPSCPRCGAAAVELVGASGRGHVYSWVVVNRALSPAFAGDAPYTILAVDLDEGARIFGRLLGDGEVTAGAPVRADFYEVAGRTLLGFRL